MLNLIHGDFYKAKKTCGIKVLFFLICACAITLTVTAHLHATGDISDALSGQLAVLSDVVIRGSIGAVLASILICGEFDNKVISNALSSGYSRDGIVTGKMISFFIFFGIILSPYCIATLVGAVSGLDFGKPFTGSLFVIILSEASVKTVNAAFVLKMLCIMILQVLSYMSQLSAVVFVAFILKKGIGTIVIGSVLTIVFDLLGAFHDKFGVVGKLIELFPFSQGFSVLSMDCDAGVMVKSFLSSIIFAVVFTKLTCLAFRRTEVK